MLALLSAVYSNKQCYCCCFSWQILPVVDDLNIVVRDLNKQQVCINVFLNDNI